MKSICLVIFTISILTLHAQAEVQYAQKILLKAEFDRSEVKLSKQVDEIKRMRTNISTGKNYYDEVQHWNEVVFVYALEALHQSKKPEAFKKLVRILNNPETRKLVYYPVRVNDGIGRQTKYVAIGDEECINPVEKTAIKQGTIIDVDKDALSHLSIGDVAINLTNRDAKTTTVIAHLPLYDESEIFKIAMGYQSMNTDLGEYYNCSYVNTFKKLEEDNRKLLRRYGELSRVLNLPTKDFSGEKKERTLTEELNGLTSTLPKDTNPILAPKEEVKAVTPEK